MTCGALSSARYSQDTLPELPDAYQAFQQGVSRKLARQRPRLGEDLLVEALQRQMDEGRGCTLVDLSAQPEPFLTLKPPVGSHPKYSRQADK
jgi:hypothetical protein